MKPELFKHEDLFEAEIETGLPLRLAFIGLFTCCDREGRFKWRPRVLKLDVLPHDTVDFSRVLHALATRGFLVHYEVDGEEFGLIPTFHRHQTINHKESASVIPPPPDGPLKHKDNPTRDRRVENATGTRDPRDEDASRGERKGKERKGKEGEVVAAREGVPLTGRHRVVAVDLLDRGKASLSPWERKFLEDLIGKPELTPKMQATLDSVAAKIGFNLDTIMATWRKRLETARKLRQWDVKWGPMPGHLGCLAPDEILQLGDGEGWTEWRAAS